MIVTTAYRPSPHIEAQAKALARDLGLRYVPRNNDTIPRLRKRTGSGAFFIVTEEGLRYTCGGERPLFFHPGMSLVRIQRLKRGERDPLADVCDVRPGDTVIDCTAGMAADAIVLSHCVGRDGCVVALESESVQAVLLQYGLASYTSEDADVNEAMRRIRLTEADHLDYLRTLDDRSADIVYFDPMFRDAVAGSETLAPLRKIANAEPLSREAVAEARRVARKKVVLKERIDSGEFERLGFRVWAGRDHRKVTFGVIEC